MHGKKTTEELRRCLALILIIMMLTIPGFNRSFMAQEGESPKLRIVILDGDGAINNIRQRTAREPIVRVEDENRKPVAGALVVFTLPDNGPGAVFPNGSKSLMTYSDQQGLAKARGVKPNSIEGQFQITITATFRGAITKLTLGQTNTMAAATAVAGGISAKLIAILVATGAAVATGTIIATTRGNDNGSAPNLPQPIIISPGTPTVDKP
jgi:hypothetical protein